MRSVGGGRDKDGIILEEKETRFLALGARFLQLMDSRAYGTGKDFGSKAKVKFTSILFHAANILHPFSIHEFYRRIYF